MEAARSVKSGFSSQPRSAAVSLADITSEALPSSGAAPTQLLTAYPPSGSVDGSEWDAAYARELSRPAPSMADSEEYYTTSTWEQKKFLYALGAEAAYWRMRGGNPGTAAHSRDEKEFLSMLETASPEQRLAIELCINLTKALQALMLSTDPRSEGVSAARARAIYQQIVAERPDIRPIFCYRLSRLALARSYKKGTPNPSADYLSFIAKLDEPALLAVFAMRAAFFDHLMNDPESGGALRGAAAEHYSRLLLGRPGIEPFLQQYLQVRSGIALFLSKPDASVSEDPRTHPHGWLQVLNEDEVTRSILHYELAAIFFRPEHRVLLESPAVPEPAEAAAPLSIAPDPGPLEPKLREHLNPLVEAPHGRLGKSSGRRRARLRPSFHGRKAGKIKSKKIHPRPVSHHSGHLSHPAARHHAGPAHAGHLSRLSSFHSSRHRKKRH